MAISLAIFLISLLGIIALFALKYWEERRGARLMSASRDRADVRAQDLKAYLLRVRTDAGHLLPILMRITSGLLHVAALSAAGVARSIERELHRLADMVSHKRNFQPRETKNDFLKQVSDHKNGTGTSEEDTPTV